MSSIICKPDRSYLILAFKLPLSVFMQKELYATKKNTIREIMCERYHKERLSLELGDFGIVELFPLSIKWLLKHRSR